MEITRVVHFRVRKGLGPEWVDKPVTVHLDDIEPGTSDAEIRDMLIQVAKEELRYAGYSERAIIFQEIHNT